ncbi:hypothetical protein B0H13DRAFT_2568346 [Mycena leptocephala]|nr:hypothetical protein B0H13DRAFT_2568346 [Mycena leptocephala]
MAKMACLRDILTLNQEHMVIFVRRSLESLNIHGSILFEWIRLRNEPKPPAAITYVSHEYARSGSTNPVSGHRHSFTRGGLPLPCVGGGWEWGGDTQLAEGAERERGRERLLMVSPRTAGANMGANSFSLFASRNRLIAIILQITMSRSRYSTLYDQIGTPNYSPSFNPLVSHPNTQDIIKNHRGEAQNQLGVQGKTCLGHVYAFASRGGLRRGVRIGGGAQQERSHCVGAFSSPGGGRENCGGLPHPASAAVGGCARVFALAEVLRSGARVVREPSRWQEAAMKTATASILRRQGVRVGRARLAFIGGGGRGITLGWAGASALRR